jgi:protein-S-isoprenylcysteine O-methyltransferase Ste14
MKRQFSIVGNLPVTLGIVVAYITVMLIINGLDSWPTTLVGAGVGAVVANLVLYLMFRRRHSRELEESVPSAKGKRATRRKKD